MIAINLIYEDKTRAANSHRHHIEYRWNGTTKVPSRKLSGILFIIYVYKVYRLDKYNNYHHYYSSKGADNEFRRKFVD